jgi:hypothetical protein
VLDNHVHISRRAGCGYGADKRRMRRRLGSVDVDYLADRYH